MRTLIPIETIEHNILSLRGHRVMLDTALAAMYGVEVRALNQAVKRNAARFPADFAFRLSAAGVRDETQIHTHMCYAEFNDIIEAVAELDADVISIETSRSQMELLDAFVGFKYPNEIGPGVYDIHSRGYFTKNCVPIIKMRSFLNGNKKLATIRIRTTICHRQHPWLGML